MEERAYKSHPFHFLENEKVRFCGWGGKGNFSLSPFIFSIFITTLFATRHFSDGNGRSNSHENRVCSLLASDFTTEVLIISRLLSHFRPYFGPRPESRSDGTRGSQRMAAEQDLRGLDDEHDEHDELALD